MAMRCDRFLDEESSGLGSAADRAGKRNKQVDRLKCSILSGKRVWAKRDETVHC